MLCVFLPQLCMRAKMAATIFGSPFLLLFSVLSLLIVLLSTASYETDACLLSEACPLLGFPTIMASRILKQPKLTNAPSKPVVEWRKHGFIFICLPPSDLTLCMDVQANPGPPLALADLRSHTLQTGNVLHDIRKNLDMLLRKQPNALAVLTGDFNPTSTGFRAQYIDGMNQVHLLQGRISMEFS